MKIKVRWAISRIPQFQVTDTFPIFFQPNCERTLCDSLGRSEGLFELIQRLDKSGYDLISDIDNFGDIKK